MPTYEFRCLDCGHEWDELRPMDKPIPDGCPECYSQNIKKLVSRGGGVIFRGNGWYSTDYGGKNPSIGD